MNSKINLVIVESKGKVKTITKYLNSIPELNKFGKFIVEASNGHILELDKKNGIDIDNNFKMNYLISKDKINVVKNLKKKLKDIDVVYLSSDLDLEGEFIAYSLKETLKPKKYKRVVFNEITPEALRDAFLNPRDIDYNAVEAQESRRALDRIVGFKLTACLWKNFTANNILSAGRTQSVGLLIVVDNEKEINKFKPESYYKINGSFKIGKILINEASLYKDSTIFKIKDNNKAIEILNILIKNQNLFYVNNITDKLVTEKPPLPFITSTLQQEASSKLHMSIKQVMSLAQGLYEKGLISYMRTDSYNLSETALNNIYEYIKNTYGEENYKRRYTSKKSKSSQNAHEAIRPTDSNKEITGMTDQHQKLYDLIRKRTIASQMISAIYQEGTVNIVNKSVNGLYFTGKAKVLINPGYLMIYNIKPENIDIKKWIQEIEESKNIILINLEANNTWTVPPNRYSEATFIKKLESEGIGRPSTFVSILNKLYERNFVEKKDIFGQKMEYIHYKYKKDSNKIDQIIENKELYNERSRIVPTESGITISDFLVKNFSDIININFTSQVEEKLDEISEQKLTKLKFLTIFYKKFMDTIKDVCTNRSKNKNSLKNDKDNKTFYINNKNYTTRNGKYGPLIETLENDKKKFISLKSYLTITKKNLEDITENDIKYLLNFPLKIGKKNNIDIFLVIGPYGFYLKQGEKNIKIPWKIKNEIINMKSYNTLIELLE